MKHADSLKKSDLPSVFMHGCANELAGAFGATGLQGTEFVKKL